MAKKDSDRKPVIENAIRGKHYQPQPSENPKELETEPRKFRGVITGQSPDSSMFGVFVRLLGTFELLMPNGDVYQAGELILPKRPTRALVAKLEAAQSKSPDGSARIPFNLTLWSVPSAAAGRGYEFRSGDPKEADLHDEIPEWD